MSTARQEQLKQEQQGSDLDALMAKPAHMPAELAQMKMENETIMAECRMRPRDLGECKRKLAELLREFPEFAEDAVYRRPVGKEEGSNEQKYAEGLSIRAAEALAEAYGYNRVRGDVTKTGPDSAKVDATFTDFATGRIWQDGRLVSQMARKRNGETYRIEDSRFADLVCGAAKSRAIREVIVRSVNPALKAWFENECNKIIASLLTDDKVEEIVCGFEKFGISLAQLEGLLGRPRAMGWTVNERAAALKIFSGLKNNEYSPADLIAKSEPKQGDAPKTTADLVARVKAGAKRDPLADYRDQLARCTTEAECRDLYERCGNPDASGWTSEQDRQARSEMNERIAAVKGGAK